MTPRLQKYGLPLALAFGLLAAAATQSRAIENYYPYSIMAPERGTVSHSRAARGRTHAVKTTRGRVGLPAKQHGQVKHGQMKTVARGSSGVVLPTPLPRTEQIPPIRSRIPTPHGSGVGSGVASNPGLTILPNLAPIPNLPHGSESFQDRASRCAHQQGLYGVPGDQAGNYMHACAM